MLVTMILLLILALGLGALVLAPLISSNDDNRLPVGVLQDEAEFRRMIRFRDALINRLRGRPLEGDFPELDRLNDEQALEGLISICRSLKKLGFQPLPDEPPKQTNGAQVAEMDNSGGKTNSTKPNLSLLLFIASALVLSHVLGPTPAWAEQNMPGLTRDDSGISTALVHQFVLSPAQGEMRVYYMTLFSSERAETVKLRIPSPTGARDFDFSSLPNAQFSGDGQASAPLLEFTTNEGINQIQGLFTIPAFDGTLNWHSKDLQFLPGVALFILPEYTDLISSLFGDTFTRLGVWPPRFISYSEDLELRRTSDPPAERDPNFTRLKNPPTQYSYHLLRRGELNSPYPQFVVRGIEPNRLPGTILVSSFGALLAGVALLLAFHPSFGRRLKRPQSSPSKS